MRRHFQQAARTELLRTKEAAVAEALQRILLAAGGYKAVKRKTNSAGAPHEVNTGTGAELESNTLVENWITQRFKESINSLAAVDAPARTLKKRSRRIRRTMETIPSQKLLIRPSRPTLQTAAVLS